MALEGYDLVMLGILAGAALLGYFKGMVWQLAWIAGIAASSVVSFRFAHQLAPYFGQQAPWNRFAAMLALYVGTSLVVWLLFRAVSGAIKSVHLSAFDQQLGLLLGLAKGALLCIIVTFFAVTLAPDYRHQIVGSRSGRLVADLIVRADTYLPKDIHDTVDPFVRQFEQHFQDGGASDGGMEGNVMASLAAGQASTFARPQGAGSQAAGGQSSLQAAVNSAAAWANMDQGGQGVQQAVGTLPSGSAWFVPKAQPQPAAQPIGQPQPAVQRASESAFSKSPPPSAYGAPAQASYQQPSQAYQQPPQSFQQQPPQSFQQQAPQQYQQQPPQQFQQQPPQSFPRGAQTPLPVR